MGVAFALQGRRQLALPSTQRTAAARLAACVAHFGPRHEALPAGDGAGPPRHPAPAVPAPSPVRAVPAGAGAGLHSINPGRAVPRPPGRRAGEEVGPGQCENAGERPGETGWGPGDGRGEDRRGGLQRWGGEGSRVLGKEWVRRRPGEGGGGAPGRWAGRPVGGDKGGGTPAGLGKGCRGKRAASGRGVPGACGRAVVITSRF